MPQLNEVKISLFSYILGCFPSLLVGLQYLPTSLTSSILQYWLISFSLVSVIVHINIFSIYNHSNPSYQIAWRAGIIGTGSSLGFLCITLINGPLQSFGIYLIILTLFHFSEYFCTALFNHQSLSLESFLLNHGIPYAVAALVSWLEFLLEMYFFPSMKQFCWVILVGLFLCIGGEIMRKAAMFTAGTNFNHLIQVHRHDGHNLITHGVYSICRHPAYVGWFYWSVGTQLILCNPICTIGYTIATWNFFKSRINLEEITLLNFFGEDYVQYQKSVPTGLPFIRGYRIEA